MTDTDLDKLSLEELQVMQKDVAKAIEREKERRIKTARQEVEAKAQEFGFTLSDLAEEKGPRMKPGQPRPKAPQPPKYRHPENDEITWSGRGRQPTWFKEALENGKTADDLLVSPAS